MTKTGRPTIWLKTGILLAMFALALTSLREKSPTFDEQGFLVRGVAYLRGENQSLRVGHPLGLNALNSLFLSLDEEVVLPTEDPSWQGTGFHRPAELFLWEIGNDVEQVMFEGRLPTIWLGMVLAALAGRWAWAISKRRLAGILAMLLLALDPNILAHARLATTDLGLAAAALAAGYGLWRFWQRPGWQRALLAGATFGLLLNTKFTAGLFVPLFGLVIAVAVVDGWGRARDGAERRRLVWRPLAMLALCYPAAAFLTLWAAYGFQVGTLPDTLPMGAQLGGSTWPAAHYLEQLLDIGGRMQKSTPAFLLGQYSDSGWWYYFPVAFALKTPLPLLLLLAWAMARLVACWVGRAVGGACPRALDAAALLIPAGGYFAFALTTDINLGYRHLLAILPFLAVLVAVVLSGVVDARVGKRPFGGWGRLALGAAVAGLALATLCVYPHFLSYFNLIAGGPNGGWRALVDSNIDWGQDLAGLKVWKDENDEQALYLSYFGEGRPEYYGIDYIGLDSFPPRLMNPDANPLFPATPAPGTYAISATALQGVHFADHNQFKWFREQEPVDKIGYSIFIYEVTATGAEVDVVLGGLQLEDLTAADFERWDSNDVTAHWFDPTQSLLTTDNERTWLALAKGANVHAQVARELEGWEKVAEDSGYILYKQPGVLNGERQAMAVFESDAGRIMLTEIKQDWSEAAAGQAVEVATSWTKQGSPAPVKLFLHVTDQVGQIVAQWDGLGAEWEGWRDSDKLLQMQTVTLPDALAPGIYQVWLGVYEPASGLRWQTEADDRYLASQFEIGR